ncbi:heterokaryon incompatibility protein-domain-containing protein [Xylariales sp. AK1849]|nr:heterokaryon incompatibility protein-domain-containing protein [Xylariales sp. AK1849]
MHPVDGLVLYYKTLDSLRVSAWSCELCRLVKGQVDKCLCNGEAAAKLGFRYPEYFELWICGTNVCDYFQVLGYNKANAEKWVVKSASYQLLAGSSFCVDDASVLRTMAQGRKVLPSARSPVLLRQIQEWMRTTAAIHTGSPYVPSRLLRIEDNGHRVQLSSPRPIRIEFACLSHCWGLTQPLMLNHHTYEKLWNGCSTSELPRSFQDSIWLTHQLGIHYLWIDSLCILQDDVRDWVRESAHMGKIYQNATITLAASQANNSSEGFLERKVQRVYTPAHIYVGGIQSQVLLFPIPLKLAGNPARLVEMEGEPLTDRGWAMQERYMARRTIHFTQDQVLLEGESKLLTEESGFTMGLPTQFTLSASTRESHAWTQVVERYSRRKLVREEDKLPAMAGIAAYFSSLPEDETSKQENRYLAGLWSTDLVKNLCWRVAYGGALGARPTEYRAPTWSWVSIDGPITFLDMCSNSLMIVQDAQVELKRPDNVFGEVTSGWVFLKAIQLKPHTVSADGHYLGFSENGTNFWVDAGFDAKGHCTKEQLEQLMTQKELTVVLVGWQETQVPLAFAGPVCLILTPVEHRVHPYDSTPTYERVGSGIARPAGGEESLMKLITEKWMDAFERGDLADILLV